MKGLSDKFAYTNHEHSQPHTYNYLKQQANPIFTPSDNKIKLGKDEQDKKIRNMKKSRDMQDKVYKQFNKQRQKYAIVKAKMRK